MNRIPRRDRLVGPGIGQARDDGGHRIDPRDLAARPSVPRSWCGGTGRRARASNPATSVDRRPTTSALMWKSGSELNPRSFDVSRWCADHAAGRVQELLLGQGDHLGDAGRARRGQHRPARHAPVPLPPAARGRRCLPSARGRADVDPADVDARRGPPRSAKTMSAPTRAKGLQQATRPVRGCARVERRRPATGGHRAQEGHGEIDRIADDETDRGALVDAGRTEHARPVLDGVGQVFGTTDSARHGRARCTACPPRNGPGRPTSSDTGPARIPEAGNGSTSEASADISVHHPRVGVVLELDQVVGRVTEDKGAVHLDQSLEADAEVAKHLDLALRHRAGAVPRSPLPRETSRRNAAGRGRDPPRRRAGGSVRWQTS